MLVIRIWNYFRGYVIIKIEGLTLEKFINLAIAKGIYLWDIVRYDYTTLEAKVGISGFKELRDVVKKVGCRVSITRKKGYPFLIHKFKYRKMLALGSVVAVIIILFMTSYIWSIDVIGEEDFEDEIVINLLADYEIKPGIKKSEIDVSEIRKFLLMDIEALSYAHAEIKGTKLIIDIRERDLIPEIVEETTPCNIVSTKKAVIDKVVAKNGRSVVEKGDIVKEGQILITGVITDERLAEPLLVHSEGAVYGITRYKEVINEPVKKVIKEETGRSFKTREIKIGDKRLQFINGDIPYSDYIEEVVTKKIIDWDRFSLPIEIVTHNYKEVTIKEVIQNIDSLKKMTSVNGVNKIMKILPKDSQVISKDVNYSIVDNILTTEVNIEVREEIGIKKKVELIEGD